MNKQRSRKAGMLGISAALAAVMAAPGITAAQDETMEGAEIRVLHGADAPAVDIWANGAPAITDLEFGENTDWIPLPAGDYQLQVTPAGAGIDDPASIVLDATVTLTDDTMTTIVATGNLDDFGIVPQLVPDAPAPTADMTDIKVGHMSWDAPAVNIVTGDTVVVEGLAYPDAQGPLTVPGGAYDFDVVVAESGDVAIDLPELTFENGVAYSVYAIGSIANESLTAVRLVDAELPGVAEVRVLHGSPDAPAVDVYANGGVILENAAFGALSPYLEVPAGTYRIQVVPTGDSLENAVIDAELTFEDGTSTTVAATGSIAAGTFGPQVLNDAQIPANAQIRVVHLSADSPRVDIAPDEAGKKGAIVKKLRFGRSTDYLTVPAGEYDLEVRPADGGKNSEVFDIPPFTAEAGKSYAAIAIGSLADGTFNVLLVEEN